MSKRWIGLAFVLGSLLFSVLVYHQLPARIATHFDVHGNPDGYSSRLYGAFIDPVVCALFLGILNIVPRALPRRENFLKFEDTYWAISQIVIAFLCVMNVLLLGRALGWPVSVPTFVLLAMGAMFVIIGNLLPRTRSNWFMGIRTPWTLDSEYAWRETHRLGGRTFVAGGLVTMVAAFLPAKIQPIVAIAALVIAGFIPVVYSYIFWRREKQGTA